MKFYFRQIKQQVERPKAQRIKKKKKKKKQDSHMYWKGSPCGWDIECRMDENKFVEVEGAKIMQELGCVINLEKGQC